MTNGTLFLISALWAEPCFQFCKGTGVEGKEDRGSPFLYPWLGQRCSITPQGLEKHEKRKAMNAPIHVLHPPQAARWPGSKAGSRAKHTNTGPAQAAPYSQAASVRVGQNRSHPSLCCGFSSGWEHLQLLYCPLQQPCLVQDLGIWCAFKPWVYKLHGAEHQRVPKIFFHLSPVQQLL